MRWPIVGSVPLQLRGWYDMRVERTPRLVAFWLAIWLVAGSHASEIEITFTSSYDQSEQKALAFVPTVDGEEKRPLLVIAHFYSGNRGTANGQGECLSTLTRSAKIVPVDSGPYDRA